MRMLHAARTAVLTSDAKQRAAPATSQILLWGRVGVRGRWRIATIPLSTLVVCCRRRVATATTTIIAAAATTAVFVPRCDACAPLCRGVPAAAVAIAAAAAPVRTPAAPVTAAAAVAPAVATAAIAAAPVKVPAAAAALRAAPARLPGAGAAALVAAKQHLAQLPAAEQNRPCAGQRQGRQRVSSGESTSTPSKRMLLRRRPPVMPMLADAVAARYTVQLLVSIS